eukprot:3182060-Rhodomonas_salina.1
MARRERLLVRSIVRMSAAVGLDLDMAHIHKRIASVHSSVPLVPTCRPSALTRCCHHYHPWHGRASLVFANPPVGHPDQLPDMI